MPKLFKPFVQLDSSLSRQHAGTGLGLSLVQRMAELHGGSVHVESTPGEGSRFTIVLPWSAEVPQSNTLPTAPPALLHNALTVEDSEIDAEQLTRYLRQLGITNVVHPSVQGSLELASRLRPGVILLDLNLPDGSGFDMLDMLKRDPRTSTIPVIICSVFENRQRAAKLGAVGYLVKPISLDDIRKELRRIPQAPERIERALTIAPHHTGPTIMIVDDNELNLETLSDYLAAQNMNPVTARSGNELLDIVAGVLPDLILMDIQMPGMDGLEATRRIRAHTDPQIAQTPIIALTALAMPGDRDRCIAAGANEYMSKPITLAQLRAQIREFVGNDEA